MQDNWGGNRPIVGRRHERRLAGRSVGLQAEIETAAIHTILVFVAETALELLSNVLHFE